MSPKQLLFVSSHSCFSFRVTACCSILFLAALLAISVETPYAATPKYGGTLILATSGEEGDLNPHVSTGAANQPIMNNIFNCLLYLGFNFELIPGLAESWEISKDGLTYTFNLAKNATWHDGKPFTSADVLYTLNEIYPQNPRALWWKSIKDSVSLKATDDHTVVIKLQKPFAPFLILLAFETGAPSILPKHLYEGTDLKKNPYNTKPVGTGPFMFKEWVRGSHVELVRNPNYFGKGKEGKPYVDRLVVRFIPDPSARIMALRKGDIDFLPSAFVPFEEVAGLRKDPKITIDLRGSNGMAINFLAFNLRNPILAKEAVRQAIAYGIDRQKIVNFALAGEAKLAKSIIYSKIVWAFNAKVPEYSYNPQKANELLDKAGMTRGAEGVRFKMRLLTAGGRGSDIMITEVIRDSLKQIGIDAQLVSTDLATFYDSLFMRWDFDTAIQIMATGPDPTVGVSRFLHSKQIRKISMANVMGYNNPEVDKLLDTEFTQVDLKERAATWRRIQEIVMDDLPVMPIYEVPVMNCHRSDWIDIVTRLFANNQSRENAYRNK